MPTTLASNQRAVVLQSAAVARQEQLALLFANNTHRATYPASRFVSSL